MNRRKQLIIKALDLVDQIVKHGSHNQQSHGRGGSKVGMPSKAEMKAGGITVASSGQIKLKKPKDAKTAIAQIEAMDKIFKLRERQVAEGKIDKIKLIRDHTLTQMRRSLGYASKLAAKSIEDLKKLIAKVCKEYGIEPDPNPSDEDPVLELERSLILLSTKVWVSGKRVDWMEDYDKPEKGLK